MDAIPDHLSPDELTAFLKRSTETHGTLYCDKHAAVTYSGPSQRVIAAYSEKPTDAQRQVSAGGRNVEYIRTPIGNRRHAANMYSWLNACMIDHTRIGVQAFKVIDVYKYYKKNDANPERAVAKANMVARTLSREFIQSSEGQVFTNICGADRKRIFVDTELPEIMKNDRITHINGVPMDAYKTRLTEKFGADYIDKPYQDELLRHVALTELKLLKALAETLPMGKVKKQAALMYCQSRDLYRLDRGQTADPVVAERPIYQGAPADLRQQRKADIQRIYQHGVKPRQRAMAAGLNL